MSDRVPEIGFLGKYFLPVKYGFVSQVEQGRYIILQFLALVDDFSKSLMLCIIINQVDIK